MRSYLTKEHFLDKAMKLLTAAFAFSLLLCTMQHGIARTISHEQNAKHLNKPVVPALLAFGDSIFDSGNNNQLQTMLRSDFLPYGEDFITHRPTGRFCNGRIPTDFIASKLGIKELLPAYLSTSLSNEDLITGVSFASGGTGFDPITSQLAAAIPMTEQLEMFKKYREKVKGILGERGAKELLAQSAYLIVGGSNDLASLYFSSPLRSSRYDSSSYADFLLHSASSFIQELIQLGARKIGIVGIPPIGCVPSQRTLQGGFARGCASIQNEVAQIYNSRLTKELEEIKKRHQNTTLVHLDIYAFLFDMIEHPTKYGFEVSYIGCCGTGLLEAAFLCNPMTLTVCTNVSRYIFWDSFHPTEKAYSVLVNYIYKNYFHHLVS
ncbi:GDSL esterase/lipase EXL3 [Rhynchospora pubera]|uniref:GDSL esterase/lipase EXL3 n=1 Tax=Rhynchospora pubera TaxID=906938 RepID=A0AAV8CVT7_9POAL|nr:GDSL esterase/lipase EXL3 [Rhynchospora pubera]